MPSIDELLDTEATKWRAEVDAHFDAATFAVEPPAPQPLRRRIAWAGSGLAAAAAVAAIVVATRPGSSGSTGPALAGPTLERSGHPAPSSTPTSHVVGPEAQCAAPVLSFRDPERGRHFRPVPRLTHPVRPGHSVRIFGDFFVTTCNDTGQGEPNQPARSVPLVLRTADGARRVVLRAHPHGNLGRFVVRVRIPDDAAPGPAAIGYGRRYGKVVLTVAGA